MRPQRIQLKRTKGWKMPPNTVKVDRSTRWGNPWRVVNEDNANLWIASESELIELIPDEADPTEYLVEFYRQRAVDAPWSLARQELGLLVQARRAMPRGRAA